MNNNNDDGSEEEGTGERKSDLSEVLARIDAISKLPVKADRGVNKSEPKQTVLDAVDVRIASGLPSEAIQWLQVRREIVDQNEFVTDRAHLRTMQKVNAFATIGLSIIALVVGIILVLKGSQWPGYVCIGAGLYCIAPKLIEKVFGSGSSNER